MSNQMSQADIDDVIEGLTRAVQAGRISTEEFNNRVERAQKGLTNLDQALADSAKQFKTSMVQFGAGIYEGKLGQSQYNDALNSGADTIAKMSAYAGPLGVAFGALLKVITFGITEVNKMSDALYQSTTELSKAGVVGQEGMMGVAQSAREFGYGLDQLANLTTLLTTNSTTLAQLGGTAVDGVKKFGLLANEMKPLQEHFMLMGMTVDDINNGMASYLRVNAQYGQTQKMTTTELATASKDYLENMAKLSKLTGESAEALAKQQEHANTIDVWAGYIQHLRDTGQNDLADIQAKTYTSMAATFGEAQADAYANQVSGIVGLTEGATQQFMATNGKSLEIATAGAEMSADMRVQAMADASMATKSTQMFLSQVGNAGETFGHLNEQQKMWNMSGGRYIESVQKAAKESGETSDAAMKASVHERRMQMQSRDAMQDLVKSGIVPVTEAMEGLASIINHIVHPFGTFDERGNYVNPEQLSGKSGANLGIATGGDKAAILDLIGKGESGGDYNKLVGGKEADLTNMTLQQVSDLQKTMTKANGFASSAVGKYQMINSTMLQQAREAGLDLNTTKFDQKTQDLLASRLVDKAGWGKADAGTVMKNLAGTWASLPKDMSGKGAYDGYNGNQVGIKPGDVLAAIQNTNGTNGGGKAANGRQISKDGYIIPSTWDKIVNGLGNAAEGAIEGGVEGAVIGSVIPGIGTAFGGIAGAVTGAAVGLMTFGQTVKKADDVTKAATATAKDKRETIDAANDNGVAELAKKQGWIGDDAADQDAQSQALELQKRQVAAQEETNRLLRAQKSTMDTHTQQNANR